MDTSWIGPILATYGLPGVLLMAAAWVIKTLYERNIALADRFLDSSINNAKASEQLANALNTLTEVIKERRGGAA